MEYLIIALLKVLSGKVTNKCNMKKPKKKKCYVHEEADREFKRNLSM